MKTEKEVEKLELVKGEVEVIHVQTKMSIAESFEVRRRTAYTPLALMVPFATKEEVKVSKELTGEKFKEPLPTKLKEELRLIEKSGLKEAEVLRRLIEIGLKKVREPADLLRT